MKEESYLSPFRLENDSRVLFDPDQKTIHAMDIKEAYEDTDLSDLDIHILKIIYMYHHAARSVIEYELDLRHIRQPKNLVRTLKHLYEQGCIRRFRLSDKTGATYFYSLTEGSTSYVRGLGTDTDFPDPLPNDYVIASECQLLSSQQVLCGLRKNYAALSSDIWFYKELSGSFGSVVLYGGAKLKRQYQYIDLYLYSVRGSRIAESLAGITPLLQYTAQDSIFLLICEDVKQVADTAELVAKLYPEHKQAILYTYDVLIAGGTLSNRILSVDTSTGVMEYGSLFLDQFFDTPQAL